MGGTSLKPFAPSYIGFERLFSELEHMMNSSVFRGDSSYPPMNIFKTENDDGSEGYVIELAVAGFKKNEIGVEHDKSKGILTISGKREAASDERNFIQRGIGTRQFIRQFTTADDVSVAGASMEDGILQIELRRAPRSSEGPLSIPIA